MGEENALHGGGQKGEGGDGEEGSYFFLLTWEANSLSPSDGSSSRSAGEVHNKQRPGTRPNRMCDTETC